MESTLEACFPESADTAPSPETHSEAVEQAGLKSRCGLKACAARGSGFLVLVTTRRIARAKACAAL
jgi:hypothetical protein